MSEQSIVSDDMSLKRVFQDFYRVPPYQREYVWGDSDAKDQGGDEVEQFMKDIFSEFESATKEFAPEYFIGTLVVCPSLDGVFDLIDGQQRTTTAFLTLCAIRDVFRDGGMQLPEDLPAQIAASSTDWQGDTVYRLRLDLQYEDAGGILEYYASSGGTNVPALSTRSIKNIVHAYDTIREFLTAQFVNNYAGLRRFYGYFSNKVKLIRIQTPSVDKALKIFETINDRGVGLDAMDLLKNLLFMNASPASFLKLKNTWKSITDEIYKSQEKPLRFLRYFLMSSYDIDLKLQENEIYSWFRRNERQTGHASDPIRFAGQLLIAAKAYRNFVENKNAFGISEPGLLNTRALGGRAVRQHFIMLLAGYQLPPSAFSALCVDIENLMFVWLVTNTPAKDYERSIIDGARKLRFVKTGPEYEKFSREFFYAQKALLASVFYESLTRLRSYQVRAFRLKYILSKLTQFVDLDGYGNSGSRTDLSHYMSGGNDIEHIMPETPSEKALGEFGEVVVDSEIIQSLGNLMLVERSVNRALGNKAYSEKINIYPSSQFLLVRCQAMHPPVGINDQITRATRKLAVYPTWSRAKIDERQKELARMAHEVWGVPKLDQW